MVQSNRSRLIPDDGIPLYLKLASIFRDQIGNGSWPVGYQIGTLPQLQAQYGVARATVQQAIRQLSQQGLLSSERGRGTFVIGIVENTGTDAPVYDPLGLDARFSIEILERGEATDCLDLYWPLPDDVRPFAHVRKRHMLCGRPYSLVDLFIPQAIYDCLPSGGDHRQLFAQLIRDHAGVDKVEARSTYTVVSATQEYAQLIDVPFATPLVRCDTLGISAEGRPLIALRSLIRGDQFVMTQVTRDVLHTDPQEWRPTAPVEKR